MSNMSSTYKTRNATLLPLALRYTHGSLGYRVKPILLISSLETDIQEKDKNKAKKDKTEHENEKSVKKQSKSKSQQRSQPRQSQSQLREAESEEYKLEGPKLPNPKVVKQG
ncbi:hypothetical protein Tco_0665913 [Tanacetum coccineum]